MKALFLLYEGYVDWEISPLSCALNDSGIEIETAGLTGEVTHSGNFTVRTDSRVGDCDASVYDILIIPGGEPAPFNKDPALLELIRRFDEQGKRIAAICGGTVFLSAAGVLRDRRYSTSIDDNPDYAHYFDFSLMSEKDVTVCENLITAKGNAYIEFAVAVGKGLEIFEDREDELETVLFFKNQLRDM